MAKVKFKRRTTAEINELEVEDGALIYNTDNGKTYMDFEEERIQTGGNADTIIARQTTEPTDQDIKLWINPDKLAETEASNVVDSMAGTQTDKSPSVNAVKEYVHNKSATFTCSQTGGLTLTTSYQAFPLDTQTNSVTGLTIRNDGGITIGSNVSYIKVSASTSANTVRRTINRLSVFKNNEIVARSQEVPTSYFSLNIVSKIIPVTSGDIIYLKALADEGEAGETKLSYGNDVTWLTIEVLN